MTSPKSVLEQALQLPAGDRAGVARELIASLDGATEDGADEAWLDEAETRQREASGEPNLLEDWTQVRARIAAQLRAARA